MLPKMIYPVNIVKSITLIKCTLWVQSASPDANRRHLLIECM